MYMRVEGGAVASWLVRSSLDRAVRVRALTGTLCCVLGQDTLTVPLSTQVYKWVPANLMLGVTLQWTGIPYAPTSNTASQDNHEKINSWVSFLFPLHDEYGAPLGGPLGRRSSAINPGGRGVGHSFEGRCLFQIWRIGGAFI